jgi:glutamine amidotransferase PdxT
MLENSNLKVGVLAIQGAVEEHFDALRALGAKTKEV